MANHGSSTFYESTGEKLMRKQNMLLQKILDCLNTQNELLQEIATNTTP